MRIGSLDVGLDHRPVFLAELSGNHNGDLGRALAVVDAMAEAGAHAIKLQTYTADTLTIDVRSDDFVVPGSASLWEGRTLYELYQDAHTPWEWHEAIFDRARGHGMECFSSPFDRTAIDLLESLGAPAYKIASFEVGDHDLLRAVAETGKPVLLSSGTSTLAEIAEAVGVLRSAGATELCLLKCTSAYPARPADANLRTIPHLRESFGCEVGLSDHTLGIGVAIASVALGATLIEKHVTLRRADGGVDSAFSLEPDEVRALVEQTRDAHDALGAVRYEPTEADLASRRFRRSLYVTEDLVAGDRLTRANVRSIRPGFGLAPRHLDDVLGRTVRADVARGTALDWDLLS